MSGYKILREDVENRKTHIIIMESICPICGKHSVKFVKSKTMTGERNQFKYKCDCGCEWVGNYYDYNMKPIDENIVKKELYSNKIAKIIGMLFAGIALFFLVITVFKYSLFFLFF